MIWIVFAIITACTILAIARPFGRAPKPDAASELEVYKQQLAELDREEDRGTMGKEEAKQTRTEISRRLLRASRRSSPGAFGRAARLSATVAIPVLAAVIAIGATSLYAVYGSPNLPDEPLEARLNVPPSEQTAAIQIANAERRLRENPEDSAGWNAIAPVYFASGQFDKAAEAYRKAIKLAGPDEDRLLGLFEALTFAKDGIVPAGAKPFLDSALERNPKSLRGRFWLAVLDTQDGKKAEAEQTYREMLGESIPNSWRGVISKQLAALAEPASRSAESAEASSAAPQGDQSEMIRGMVARLAARLQENPADLDGWLMLIRSYSVLRDPVKMEEAIASARKQFASEPESLGKIASLAEELKQAPANADAQASAKPVESAQAATGGSDKGQDPMIRGMVERLAARLKENAADLDGWLRLIRSYAVLKEPAKMEEAVASARKQFASEPESLGKIASLTEELKQAPAEGNAQTAAPAMASQDNQLPTIDTMVERLAARLKQNGADLDGWLMLIRSYATLKQTGKAQEAAASARKQFASEPQALEIIDKTLTRGLSSPPEGSKGQP